MSHIYGVDGEAERLRSLAERLTQEVLAPQAAEVDARGRFPDEGVGALAAAGLLGLCLPAEAGGRAEGPRAFAAVVEELSRGCASTAMVYVMHVAAAQAIATSGTLAGKGPLLREVAAGRHLTTLAFSEKGSRSQFWMPVSRLEANGDGFVTSAEKSWVTAASRADSYVSSAQRPGAASPLESTLYLVRKGERGLRRTAAFDGLGLRGNDSAPLALERHPVPGGDLLTAQGGGLEAMLQVVLPWFAVGSAAMANGLCRAAADATARHLVSAGHEGGGTLRDLPVLRARLAEMSVRTEQSRALLGYTLGLLERPSAATPLYVLESRLAAIEAAVGVTDLAMKACGGAAFSKHLPLERLFRDARAGWVMAPTADHLKEFIGRALTGLPLL